MTRDGAQDGPPQEIGVRSLLRAPALPRRARLDLARLAVLRPLMRRRLSAVRLPSGPVFVDGRTLRGDLARLADVFRRESYAADYRGASVLDIGAGKGYFAAYALQHGARRVRSYESSEADVEALSRAAAAAGADWTVEQVAVRGRAAALVPAGSREPPGPPPPGGIVAAERILPQEPPADGPLIVRLDAGGAECDVVLGTAPSRWLAVDELFVQLHDYAPCHGDDLVAHLERAGLVLHRGLDEGAGYRDLHFVREQPRRFPA